MTTEVKKSGQKYSITVTRVEEERVLEPHEVLSHRLNQKRRKKNLEREMKNLDDTITAMNPAVLEIAEDQVLLREAEKARYAEVSVAPPAALEDEIDWWTALYAEAGGDLKSLTTKKGHAKNNHTDVKYHVITKIDKLPDV